MKKVGGKLAERILFKVRSLFFPPYFDIFLWEGGCQGTNYTP